MLYSPSIAIPPDRVQENLDSLINECAPAARPHRVMATTPAAISSRPEDHYSAAEVDDGGADNLYRHGNRHRKIFRDTMSTASEQAVPLG